MMPGEGRFNIAAAMRDVVNFDGADSAHRYSRLWMLLLLAVIASAGVVGRWHRSQPCSCSWACRSRPRA